MNRRRGSRWTSVALAGVVAIGMASSAAAQQVPPPGRRAGRARRPPVVDRAAGAATIRTPVRRTRPRQAPGT
jgi:hypothetical protein